MVKSFSIFDEMHQSTNPRSSITSKSMHIMKQYSAIRGMKFLYFTMHFENVLQNEKARHIKTNIVRFHLHDVLRLGKYI